MSLPEFIKHRMQEKQLTMSALEREAGLKMDAVRNIIKGRTKNPNIKILQAIAKALNCSLEELVSLGQTTKTTENWQVSLENSKNETLDLENHELLVETVKLLTKLISEKKVTLKLDKFFLLTREVYLFSIKKHQNLPDYEFVEWLVERI